MNKKYEVLINYFSFKVEDEKIEVKKEFNSVEEARKFIMEDIFFYVDKGINTNIQNKESIKNKEYFLFQDGLLIKRYEIKEIEEKSEIIEFLIQVKDKKLWLEKDIHTKTWKIIKCPEDFTSLRNIKVYGYIEEEAFGELIDLLNFINEME